MNDIGSGSERLGLAVSRRTIGSLRQLGMGRLLFTVMFLIAALWIARFSWQAPLAIEAERALYDWRQVVAAPKVDQDDRIVQVVYTDETLAATGKRSPLDRAILAKALKRIDSFNPKAIGIDILIDQPQPEDPLIIAAFKSLKSPTRLAYASTATAEDKIMLWQQEFLDSFQKKIAPANVKPASIVIEADDDNVLRSWPKLHGGDPDRLPFALDEAHGAAFRNYEGSVQYRLPAFTERPVFAAIPIDSFAEDALFQSPEATALFRKQIEGKFVLIGGHIEDIDIFETPVNKVTGKPTWGIEIFAHMLAQQLDGRMPSPIPNWTKWCAAILFVAAASFTALSNARPLAMGLLILAQLVVLIIVPFQLQIRGFDTQGLPAFGLGLGWVLSFTAAGTAARAVGSEQRKFAQSALGKYLPRDIAAQILRDPDSLALHGEKRDIFAVFTDLEGFTKLSHAIQPEMVATLLNRYLEALSNVVLEHGGTIDKFVGDAVVAFWGAPISRTDDGERAARAAWAMYQAGETFRKSVPDGVPAIGKTRVGLHHGEAIVGNFGGEGRIQYTALGDSMNTASRLESANKQTKSNVLVSGEAAELSGLDWFRPLGRVVLRGRATPIDVLEPVPDMPAEARTHFQTLANAAIKGDVSAITALTKESAINPNDAALSNFVYRLSHQEEGGYFVLD
jgi:adenylate cyclase